MFHSFSRPHFFTGQMLSADDLTHEQDYQIAKRKLHNRYLYGSGVVTGLGVSVKGTDIVVEPGLAIDCEGNEIVVPDCQILKVQDLDSSRTTIFVAISYSERQMDKTPTNAQGETNYLRVEESFELIFGLENSNRAHRRLHGKWQSCGKSHSMTIGRLVQRQTGWHLDRRFRSQTIKR